eukprot:scaffold127649_cov58-Phaeocystis_antarctica.AAC.4
MHMLTIDSSVMHTFTTDSTSSTAQERCRLEVSSSRSTPVRFLRVSSGSVSAFSMSEADCHFWSSTSQRIRISGELTSIVEGRSVLSKTRADKAVSHIKFGEINSASFRNRVCLRLDHVGNKY